MLTIMGFSKAKIKLITNNYNIAYFLYYFAGFIGDSSTTVRKAAKIVEALT